MSTGLSSLTRFGLDEKVDKEKTWEEGSEKDGKVGTELNLKGNSVGWEARDDGVSGEGRAGNSSRGDGNGGLKGSCGEIKGVVRWSLRDKDKAAAIERETHAWSPAHISCN